MGKVAKLQTHAIVDRMAEKLLTERFTLDSTAKVDVEAGVITGARLCGENSKNGRRYERKAFSESRGKYEGVKSYVDHARDGSERSVRDLAAKVENVTIDNEGLPRGTLRFYDSTDPLSRKILNIAKTSPGDIGLSHVARCKTRFEGGVEVIESIEFVESVDIVTDPATTKGFFESKGKPMSKIKLKAFSESHGPKLGPKKWGRFEALLEMLDGAGDLEMDAPAEDESADDGVEAAMQTLAAAVLTSALAGDISAEEAGAKITAFIQTHKGETPEPESDSEDDPPAEESTKKKPGRKPAAKKESITAADVAKIVAEALKNHKPVSEAEKPKSGAKAEPKKESTAKVTEDVPADADAKKLSEWLKK